MLPERKRAANPERSEGSPARQMGGGSFGAGAPQDIRKRAIELLLLTMFSAVPLYGTQTISMPPLLAFHAAMLAVVICVAIGKGTAIFPLGLMRALGIFYIVFYIFDAAVISRSAIAASTHLVLFIAVYQAMESNHKPNEAQRLLTAALLFIASIATATHIAIVPFVIVFAFFLFRQLIHVSHLESVAAAGTQSSEPPSRRAAAFYVTGTTVIGVLLFPLLPRVRNPLVPGMAEALNNASTGLSDSIDLNKDRTITADSTVVSRVWMGAEAIPFFTPLRLKGMIYDRFRANQWLQGRRDFLPLDLREGGATRVARPTGFNRRITIQQRLIVGSRLFLPVGSYEVIGPRIYEGPTRDIYSVWDRRDLINYDVRLARATVPLVVRPPAVTNFPVSPEVAAMAHKVVGPETDPLKQAALIEHYMSTTFHYVPDPAAIGRPITVDTFLLKERRGHCEYFAAGMVALMTALNVPARLVGGFYGGERNPLTGYLVVRRADAHAWTEVWAGDRWETFDSTPAALRPGNGSVGLKAYASALGDSINYFWDRYILTFGLADQIALAVDAIGRVRDTIRRLDHSAHDGINGIVTLRSFGIAASSVIVIVFALWIARRRRGAFELLRDYLHRAGIDVGAAMTMEDALRELRRRHPDAAAQLHPLITLYEEERFSSRLTPARHAIRRRLQELRA
jgi:transglutaminase-like putative cysteine protease